MTRSPRSPAACARQTASASCSWRRVGRGRPRASWPSGCWRESRRKRAVTLAVVGDALTRSLAAEAGLDAYASVEDARTRGAGAGRGARPDAPRSMSSAVTRPRGWTRSRWPRCRRPARPGDDTATRAVPVVRTTPQSSDRASRRAIPLAVLLGGLAALVVGAVVLGATVLPAATVTSCPPASRSARSPTRSGSTIPCSRAAPWRQPPR